MKRLFAFALVATYFSSCHTVNDYDKIFKDPNIYCNAVHQLNNVVMGNNFSPIVASRNYLYAAVAGYEVIAGGYPDKWQSLAGQLRGLQSVPKPAAGAPIDYELASLLAYCELGVDSIKNLAKDHGMPDDMFDASVKYADTFSAVIMAWAKKDRYLETRGAPEYMVTDSPGRWVPTPPAYTPAMEPHWSDIRYLVMDSVREFMPPPPYKFDVTDKKSPYYQEVKLIENKGTASPKKKAGSPTSGTTIPLS